MLLIWSLACSRPSILVFRFTSARASALRVFQAPCPARFLGTKNMHFSRDLQFFALPLPVPPHSGSFRLIQRRIVGISIVELLSLMFDICSQTS